MSSTRKYEVFTHRTGGKKTKNKTLQHLVFMRIQEKEYSWKSKEKKPNLRTAIRILNVNASDLIIYIHVSTEIFANVQKRYMQESSSQHYL